MSLELFWGFYPVVTHDVTIDGEHLPIFDPMGKDTELFHHTATADPESSGSLHISEAARWFGSIWGTIARPYPPGAQDGGGPHSPVGPDRPRHAPHDAG